MSLRGWNDEEERSEGECEGRAAGEAGECVAVGDDGDRISRELIGKGGHAFANDTAGETAFGLLGDLLGGRVMHLVDIVAAMAACRHSNSYVVTASVDSIDFRNAVNLGEIVALKAQVNRAFTSSMEVGVEIYSENMLTGERKHTTSAFVTFVAIDEFTRQPKPVRPLIVKTAEEKRRYAEAAVRRKARLALRARNKQ